MKKIILKGIKVTVLVYLAILLAIPVILDIIPLFSNETQRNGMKGLVFALIGLIIVQLIGDRN